MSNAITADVQSLAQKELDSANEKFPQFHSSHEGYAILLEEVQEAIAEMADMKEYTEYTWDNVKANDAINLKSCIKKVMRASVNAACECIQVAAMAQKFLDMSENNKP